MTASAPSVTVTEWIGSSTFPRCHMDIFERDTLTITSIDDDTVMRVFQPGTWTEAVMTCDGYPLSAFTCSTPVKKLDLTLVNRQTPAA